VALVARDEHHGLPAVDDVDLLAGDQVHRLLEARPDDPELARALLLDQEVDDRADLFGRHVGGVLDLRPPGVLQEQRGLLAGGGVVVLERDEAPEPGIEQRGVGVELAGLPGQIGEGIALQHGRYAVDLVLVADELEAGRGRREVLLDVGVALPVGQPGRVELENQIVVDQGLLHAADDVDHIKGALAAASDQLVDHGRGRVADRDQVDLVSGRLLEARPVAAGIADADIGDSERPAGRKSGRRQPLPISEPKADAESGARSQHLPARQWWHSSVLVHDGLPGVRAGWAAVWLGGHRSKPPTMVGRDLVPVLSDPAAPAGALQQIRCIIAPLRSSECDALGRLVLGRLEVAGGVMGDGVAVVAVAPVRRTSCPPQARVSMRQPGVTGWDRYRKEAVDVGVPAQRAAANIVNQRRMP
jgi:hypothetical protein